MFNVISRYMNEESARTVMMVKRGGLLGESGETLAEESRGTLGAVVSR